MAQEWLGWSPTVHLRTGLARQIEWHMGLREQWAAPHHLTDRPLAAATGD
jgi:dTDP-D-glucose 4,6-dehydratase